MDVICGGLDDAVARSWNLQEVPINKADAMRHSGKFRVNRVGITTSMHEDVVGVIGPVRRWDRFSMRFSTPPQNIFESCDDFRK